MKTVTLVFCCFEHFWGVRRMHIGIMRGDKGKFLHATGAEEASRWWEKRRQDRASGSPRRFVISLHFLGVIVYANFNNDQLNTCFWRGTGWQIFRYDPAVHFFAFHCMILSTLYWHKLYGIRHFFHRYWQLCEWRVIGYRQRNSMLQGGQSRWIFGTSTCSTRTLNSLLIKKL